MSVPRGCRNRRDYVAHGAGAFRVVRLSTRVTHRAGLSRPPIYPLAALAVASGAAGDVNLGRMLRRGADPVTGHATRLGLVVHRVTRHTFDAARAHRAPLVARGARQSRSPVQGVVEVPDLVSDDLLWSSDAPLVAHRTTRAGRSIVVTVVTGGHALELSSSVLFHWSVAERTVQVRPYEVRGVSEPPAVPSAGLGLDSLVALHARIPRRGGSGFLGGSTDDRCEGQDERRSRRREALQAPATPAEISTGETVPGQRHGSSIPYSSITASMLASSRAGISRGLCVADPL